MSLKSKLKNARRRLANRQDDRYVYRSRSMVWGKPSKTPELDAIFSKMFAEACRKVFGIEDKR